MSQNTPQLEEADFIWKQLIKLHNVSAIYLEDTDLPGQNGGRIYEIAPDTSTGYRMGVLNKSGDVQTIVYTEFDVIHSEVVERDGKNFLVMDFKKATEAAREHDLNEAQDSMLYDLVKKHLAKGGKVSLMGRHWPQPIATIRPRSVPPEHVDAEDEDKHAFYPIVFKDGGIYTMDEHEFDALELDFDGGTMLLVPPALKKVQESDGQFPMTIMLAQRHLSKGRNVFIDVIYDSKREKMQVTHISPHSRYAEIELIDFRQIDFPYENAELLDIQMDGTDMVLVAPDEVRTPSWNSNVEVVRETSEEIPYLVVLAQKHLDKGQRLYLTCKLGQHTDIYKVTDINIYTFDGKVEFFLHEPAMWVKVSAAEAEQLDVDFEEDRMILTPASIRSAGSSTRVVAPVKEDLSDPMLFDLVQKWLKEQKPVFLRAADGEFLIRRVEKIGREGDMGLYRFDTWQRAWRCTSDTLERCIVDTREDGTRVVVTPGSLRESMEEGILMHLMKKHTKNHSLLVIRRSKSDPWSNMDIYVDKFFQDSDTAFRVVDAETGVVESFDLALVAPFNHAAKDQMEYELKQNIAADDGKVWLKITFNLQ